MVHRRSGRSGNRNEQRRIGLHAERLDHSHAVVCVLVVINDMKRKLLLLVRSLQLLQKGCQLLTMPTPRGAKRHQRWTINTQLDLNHFRLCLFLWIWFFYVSFFTLLVQSGHTVNQPNDLDAVVDFSYRSPPGHIREWVLLAEAFYSTMTCQTMRAEYAAAVGTSDKNPVLHLAGSDKHNKAPRYSFKFRLAEYRRNNNINHQNTKPGKERILCRTIAVFLL
jgi:hypothetical protein